MVKPELLDVVELLVDQPEQGLSLGTRGAIVEVYPDDHYEVEFINADGETLASFAIPGANFLVVWRSATQAWVPITEQLEILAARLSADTQQEVLDFARFVYSRKQIAQQPTANLA